jgi:hypothetical protein
MSKTSARLALLLLAGLTVGLLKAALAGEAEEGFTTIFNGKDLTGWDGDPRLWSVKDGVIRGQTTDENPARGNTFVIWRGGTLSDFELRLSFRISGGNSGVQIRSRDRGKWVVSGYQVEVAPRKSQMGLFYDERGQRKGLATAGQKVVIDAKGEKKIAASLGDPKEIQNNYKEEDWNDLVVIGRGRELTQKINGVVFSELTDEQEGVCTTSGILALQIHAGPPMLVEFKNIRLKPLKPETSTLKPETSEAVALFNGKDLTGWKIQDVYDFSDHGKVYVKDGAIQLEEGKPMTGIAWQGEFPKSNYEVNVEAMRVAGNDFFCGMTFPVGDSWATWINGGWGGNVVGLSNVDDMNASENETSQGRSFESNRWYRLRLRVTDEKIETWIDGEQVVNLPRKDHRFSVWEEQSPIKPFGVAAWYTGGALRNFTLKRLGK